MSGSEKKPFWEGTLAVSNGRFLGELYDSAIARTLISAQDPAGRPLDDYTFVVEADSSIKLKSKELYVMVHHDRGLLGLSEKPVPFSIVSAGTPGEDQQLAFYVYSGTYSGKYWLDLGDLYQNVIGVGQMVSNKPGPNGRGPNWFTPNPPAYQPLQEADGGIPRGPGFWRAA